MSWDHTKAINSKGDFLKFMDWLISDLETNPDGWENPDLQSYLSAFARWVKDMDGYFINMREPIPEQPTWDVLARMLYAATLYE
jgi:hypothetical protein